MLYLLFAVSLKSTFTHEGDTLLLNGKPFRWISGSFHYFRQHPSRWEDTVKKMAAISFNWCRNAHCLELPRARGLLLG
jgi:hypothetical protein